MVYHKLIPGDIVVYKSFHDNQIQQVMIITEVVKQKLYDYRITCIYHELDFFVGKHMTLRHMDITTNRWSKIC